MRLLRKRRKRKDAIVNRVRRQRAKPEVERDKNPNYWQSTWGQLVKRLASIEGGPSILSRDGKLFRRRFRVPYQVYCKLVSMCIDKNVFGKRVDRARSGQHRRADVRSRDGLADG